jgi:hypothetical protein
MKTLCLFCTIGILMLSFPSACKKEEMVAEKAEQNLIASARSYFNTQVLGDQARLRVVNDNYESRYNPRKQLSKIPLWEKAEVVSTRAGKAVVVPVQYKSPFIIRSNFSNGKNYNINDLTKLIIYKDAALVFHAEQATYFPDQNYNAESADGFQGLVSVEDWYGKPLKKYRYENGKNVKRLAESQVDQSSGFYIGDKSLMQNSPEVISRINSVTVCYYTEGYNQSADGSNGYYWSEFLGCSTYYFDDGKGYDGDSFGGGSYGEIGGGGGGFSPANTITIPTGDNVIGSISDYLKCFDNVPGNDHTYKVTLCVAQPYPGTRENWGFSGSGAVNGSGAVFVGHTFLILTETTPNKTITRNVGFYPKSNVSPFSPSAQGHLNNDANSDYNISLTITMTNSQFAQILQYIQLGNNSGFMYNLNSNNCSTFALNALKAGGINLPRTEGSWLNGSGLNPGDLGEDIRAMSLSSNMSRSTAYTYHPNQGNCQ